MELENLKKALGEELYGNVMALVDSYNAAEEHKESPIKLADLSGGEYVSKDKYAALETESTGRKKQLEDMAGELKTLRDSKTADPDTQAALDALQQKYDADTQVLQEEISKAQFDGLLGTALAGSRARNVRALRGMLDMDRLKVEDGKLVGFDDQLASIRKDAAYLFEPEGAWAQEHGGDPLAKSGVEEAFTKINPGLKID